MEIAISYTALLVASVVQFVLGALWYSPLLFGKQWMQIMEVAHFTKEELQKMQKSMGPFYLVQFLMTVLFTYVLYFFLSGVTVGVNIYVVAFWIWLGFIVPTQVSGVIWGRTDKKFWAKQIAIMISYQFVGIMLATYIAYLIR